MSSTDVVRRDARCRAARWIEVTTQQRYNAGQTQPKQPKIHRQTTSSELARCGSGVARNVNWERRGLASFLLPPRFPFPFSSISPYFFLLSPPFSFLFLVPFFILKSRILKFQLRSLGKRYELPVGSGAEQPKSNLVQLQPERMRSGGNNFNYFPKSLIAVCFFFFFYLPCIYVCVCVWVFFV